VRAGRTTRCCSAVALIAAAALARAAPRARAPLSLFPLRTLWTISLNNDVVAAPAFDGAIGYFPIEAQRIVSYDLASGARKWIVPADPQGEPVAADGLLFVVEPEALTARSAADGSIAWQLPLADALAVAPVARNGWLIVATAARDVVVYRAIDGALLWRRTIAGVVHARPAVTEDRIYVPTEDGHVIALAADTGATIWDGTLSGAANDILVLGDRLYVGSNDNHLYCMFTKDGSIDWKWPTGGDVVGVPAHDRHNVYFVSLDNVLRALDLKSGGQRWMTPVPLRPSRGAVEVDGTLIVTGVSSKVGAFNTADGKPAGDVPSTGDLAAAPYVIAAGPNALPLVILVTRDIAKGATVTALTRSIEPQAAPVAPLPNITPVPVPKT
jgi:outer membrane protein assembly factor BamB